MTETAVERGYYRLAHGSRLFYRLDSVAKAQARVVIVHGIGEYSGRYDDIAARFNTIGITVLRYDHYGHGKSDGKRATLLHPNQLDQDLDCLLHRFDQQSDASLPLLLFGHSMGGLVAANRVALSSAGIDGLILSSPAFRPYLPWLAKPIKWLSRITPNLTFSSMLSPLVSHVPAVNQQLQDDPLCHRKISPALADFIFTQAEYVSQQAPQWQVPTLLLYAGADKLVDPRGSQEFAEKAPRAQLTAQCFGEYYHEIFHESDPEPLWSAVEYWLAQRFAITRKSR